MVSVYSVCCLCCVVYLCWVLLLGTQPEDSREAENKSLRNTDYFAMNAGSMYPTAGALEGAAKGKVTTLIH